MEIALYSLKNTAADKGFCSVTVPIPVLLKAVPVPSLGVLKGSLDNRNNLTHKSA